MKNLSLLTILFFFLVGTTTYAQQADRIQRGQRGYVPPPKYSNKTFIELHDVEVETKLIVDRSVKEFSLDDFQREILKNLVSKKLEDENAILSDDSNSREDRKKKVIDRNNLFLTELNGILTPAQVEAFRNLDFSELEADVKEEKKRSKRKRRRKSKNS